jgi:hypothetical protein
VLEPLPFYVRPDVNEGAERARIDKGEAAMSHAGGDAIFDFLQICRHGVKLIFGVTPPTSPQASPGSRLPAIYRRIQAATPPPRRADGTAWQDGILDRDGQVFQPSGGGDSWRNEGVRFVEDIASLGQPAPRTIVLDRWLRVPADPVRRPFTDEVDPLGFLSASYPQPVVGAGGVTHVQVDYNKDFDLPWSRDLKPGSWVAISFDRFWPPERESVEYIGQVQKDCDHPAATASA